MYVMNTFELMHKLRQLHAWQIGLIGLCIFSISFFIKNYVPEPFILFPELSYRIGESLMVVGFIGYVLEHHTIRKYIAEEISGSLLDELFKHVFTREQLKDFITRYIKYYNKYEYIEPEIQQLLELHGIPEMTENPRRENVRMIMEYIEDMKDQENLIIVSKSISYRAKNGANKRPDNQNKLLNKAGNLYATSMIFYESLFDKSDLEKCLKTHFKFSIKCRPSFSEGKIQRGLWHEITDVTYKPKKDFKYKKCLKRELTSSPKLYVVYDVSANERTNERDELEIQIFSNIAIPPQEYIDIELKIIHPTEDSNINMFNFNVYTHTFSYNLIFDEECFRTDLEENIIGIGSGISNKSCNSVNYTGWILPHSSVAVFWSRIKSQ